MSLGPAQSAPAEALLPEMEKCFQGEQLHSWGQALVFPVTVLVNHVGLPCHTKTGFQGDKASYHSLGFCTCQSLGLKHNQLE